MGFYMLWLTKVFGLHISELTKFISVISPKDAYYLTLDNIKELKLTEELENKLLSKKIKDDAKIEFEFCQKENIKILDITSNDYPYNLLNTPTPPVLLYYKGTLLPQDEISVSIVGSRKYTEYGKICTQKFSSELTKAGVTTVSGMAYGIDTFAHTYTLKEKGRTIAVLGSGINVIYPEENRKLYFDIIENGAVISEFPLNTPPISKNFPIRNRIVAGLSMATLVIEANKKSGTMITARLAAESGRNVYAVPGQIFSQSSAGTNLLIKDGAKPATCTLDIIEDIYPEISENLPKSAQLSLFEPKNLSKSESIIYSKLSLNPTSVESLVENVDLPVSEINSALTLLEISGYIKSLPGKQYVVSAK